MTQHQNPYQSPQAETAGSILHRILRGIDRLAGFGFTLLDPTIMVYAAGTGICGVGAGLFIDSSIRNKQIQLDSLGWLAIGLMAMGAIIANVAHERLKGDARRALLVADQHPTESLDQPGPSPSQTE